MKKRILLVVLAVIGLASLTNVPAASADTFRGSSSSGCVNSHVLVKDVSLVGQAMLMIDFHVKTEGQTVAGGRWESSSGGIGPTWFMQSPFDNFVPAGTGRGGVAIGTDINIARGASGKASYVLRETSGYPGCFYVDNVVVTRIPYNDAPPDATPPPTPPPGEFATPEPTATPTPTPTGHPTPTPAPTSPPCSADPNFDENECPPPEGYCYGFGPPAPGATWPIYQCDVDPSPSPTPEPGCTTGEETRVILAGGVEYTYRVVVFCEDETYSDLRIWCPAACNRTDYFNLQEASAEAGEVRVYMTLRLNSLQDTLNSAAQLRYEPHECSGSANNGWMGNTSFWTEGTPPTGAHGPGLLYAPGYAVVAGTAYCGKLSFNVFDVNDTVTAVTGESEFWFGPIYPNGGASNDQPWEGEDVSPEPTPSPSPSPSPSPGPYTPPSPPPGYPSPDPNGPEGPMPSIVPAVPDPGAFDGVMLKLQSKAPFNYVIQVTTALENAAGEAAGGAGPAGGTYGCFDLPRWTPEGTVNTEACVPLQDMANDAAPFRGALLAMLIIGVGVGILKWTMKATGGGS